MLRTGRVSDPDALITLLEEFAAEPRKVAELTDEQRRRLMIAAGQLSRPDRYTRKALRKGLNRKAELATKAADRAILDGTGIRALRKLPIFTSLGAIPALPPGEQIDDPAVTDDAPDGGAWAEAEARRDDDAAPRRVTRARNCYVCKADFHDLHWFYDQMCPACADENWAKRNQSADLRGRVALVTGGRVKIGAQIAQKLLRAGAEVIVVTRFPVDAARRLAAEPDGDELATRAHVFGCDLRHTPSVETLCAHVRAGWSRLDVLINNACQTVRRPSGFYDHLLAGEAVAPSEVGPRERAMLARWWGEHPGPATALPDGGGALVTRGGEPTGLWRAAILSQVPVLADDLERGSHLFPAGRYDADLQQVDLRDHNSWRMALADVPTAELLEVQLVNAIAPFVLCARLKPLLAAVPTRDAHVVNVSAMEGQFYRRFKTEKHPHTNMAKAALNMLTRTSAADYVRDGIYMNAVDTGWVTDEDPATIAARKVEVHGFHPPLDIIDGAARVLDPVFAGHATGRHLWGRFLKDYRDTPW
jgi:NAD(P)-dependent dehydrogenase (short-subunit alcohol dehydrogenase family)